MCLPIGSMLLRSKILWMKHVVFWREPDGVIPRATGDWLTGRWDSRKVLRHCHNTWKTSTYARRCWSSRFWHSDWKSGLFPDFYRKYSKVRTFPGPGGQQLKIRTFPGNKDPWEPCILETWRYLSYSEWIPCSSVNFVAGDLHHCSHWVFLLTLRDNWKLPLFTGHWHGISHWGQDKMDAISQTPFSSAFPWMEMFEF